MKLTENQKQIYQMFADGYKTGEIAKELGKSNENVQATMFHIKKKFGCKTRTNMACELIRKGVID